MKTLKYIGLLLIALAVLSCAEDEEKTLRDDYLMKTVAPAIVGEPLEFAYALGALEGILGSATAEASIAGAPGTGFDPNSYHTDSRGNDVGVLVADTSTENNLSLATFTADTVAATLRYTYIVPEEAKGRSVSFTFSGESTTGETVNRKTPELKISKMDLKRDIVMTNEDRCYFSLETMEAYTEAEVIDQGMTEKIDLIYGYDALTPDGYIYGHVLFSPGSEERYRNGRTVPDSFKKNKTKIEKYLFILDMQLSGAVPATFVDDIDFQTLDLSHALDYILSIKNNNSAFIESEDGRYRAYIYVNRARSRTLTFGIKRYVME